MPEQASMLRGLNVCGHDLDAVVPLQPATMSGRNVIQWDKDDCEDLGIVKIDLLGLVMLAAMEHALEVRSRRGDTIDLTTIQKDGSAVFALLCRAYTIGNFQVESRVKMAILTITQSKQSYEPPIQVAIILHHLALLRGAI